MDTVKPIGVHNCLNWWAGLLFLFLNKIRHTILGYTSPRTFSISKFQRAIKYDFDVVEHWLYFLEKYVGHKCELKDKTVLELGPGGDLGVGLILLMRGVKKYNAMDINDLQKSVPTKFYDLLFDYMRKNIVDNAAGVGYLKAQLKLTHEGNNDKLNYVCRKDFDISFFKEEPIDLIFSQAVFEHFDDVEITFLKLSEIIKTDGILIAEIDLKTHSRWIRDVDPLNIYRYCDFIYQAFHFSGSPNRLRPHDYKNILEKQGWLNVKVIPLTQLEKGYFQKTIGQLSKRFQNPLNQMEYLSIMLCATKS